MDCDDRVVAADVRMISLGFGKFARADRIYALERLLGEERGDGRRTRVWVEGIPDPITASRTEGTILRDMGQDTAADGTDERAEGRTHALTLGAPARATVATCRRRAGGRDQPLR